MKKLLLVSFLALIVGIGPVVQKFSYGVNSHPEYDSRVPGKLILYFQSWSPLLTNYTLFMYYAVTMMELGKLVIAYIYVIKDRDTDKGILQQCKDVWTLSPLPYVFKFCIPAVLYAISKDLPSRGVHP